MMKQFLVFVLVFSGLSASADVLTPEKLWQVERVSALGLSQDKSQVFFKVTTPDVSANDFDKKVYKLSVDGGPALLTEAYEGLLKDKNLSPDGTKKLFHKEVLVNEVAGKDRYEGMDKAEVNVYDSLDYRHWSTYNQGKFNHVFYRDLATEEETDIMPDEPYYTPQMPFGGDEDYIWGPEGKNIYYVSKKLVGTEYANSTNSDIYKYNLKSKKTENITKDNPGYDTSPAFSSKGTLAWLQMKTPGYEADKNDIIVKHKGFNNNLTAHWDGTVRSFKWAEDGEKIYFTAPVDGTIQLFSVDDPGKTKRMPDLQQLSEGQFDVTGIVGEVDGALIVTRTDMNHAPEIYRFDLEKQSFKQLSHVNDDLYESLDLPTVKKRMVKTQDGHDMLTWVIYPPNFDKNKKYPTLLYAQGGPQSALSQFYSYRWNFQVMASQGYIIVAPNRRGMPGHGVKWNEAISKDWGGKAMQDYLDAIDDVAKESYVDKDRLGAIGASFGGYSVFYLAGHHDKRFKTFIAHAGVFDLRSMYGTTEELFFVNHDMGGPYWEKDNKDAQKALEDFNPVNFVSNWDTPILVMHGNTDYRVPIGQGLAAFQAAQLQGIKSRLVFFPDENHWISTPQNGLIWQKEFFKWLEETL